MAFLRYFQNQVSFGSRVQKINYFYRLYKDGLFVLDAGVSSSQHALLPSSNLFLKSFRYDPEFYTGLGVEDLSQMSALYPGKRFVEYPGGRFPFNNK
jgi:hypothetical protein